MGLFTSFQLKSRDADTRRRAASTLGVPGRASSIPLLEPLLRDDQWRVREAAAQAIGRIGEAAGVRPLLEAVRAADAVSEPDGAAAVRAAAVAGLVAVGAAAVPASIEALRDRHARLREAAIEALGGIGGPDAARALEQALADDRSAVRQAAAPALARAGGAGATTALRSALGHKDPATRRAVVAAFGTIPGADAALLAPAITDRERGVREAAATALASIGSPAAVEALCTALLTGDRDLRPLAAAGLKAFAWSPADGRQRAIRAVLDGRFAELAAEADATPCLVALAADRDATTRRGVADALAGRPDPSAVTALVSLLADQEAAVREAAVNALGRTGPAVAPELVRALDDRTATTRDAALKALGAVGEDAAANLLARRLAEGRAATHAGLSLRVVTDRDALDAARHAADGLAILLAKAASRLSPGTLHSLAAVDDVMLIEPGERPDPDARVAGDDLRDAAAKELRKRGI
jgi:HEAT repeat protein